MCVCVCACACARLLGRALAIPTLTVLLCKILQIYINIMHVIIIRRSERHLHVLVFITPHEYYKILPALTIKPSSQYNAGASVTYGA